ncbi:hypothetical protein PCASD_17946 [Puccinia coronata f. sp. avenae]|uniref:Uncharacterized protein n=1 Tax=Puccinia coronata f. sp. avenae TaxID=200324 RepID=A0A2N5U409_9BASI|nr:hypothetical protein PCASD_17946 [Puccinia coronata f. sp. avenae]
MQDYLPPGYPHNVHAQEAVLAAIRLLLKHEGGLIRNVLLQNIIPMPRRPITGPVTNLKDLIIKVNHSIQPTNRVRSVPEIKAAYHGTTRIHLVIVRLAIAHSIFNPTPTSPLTIREMIDKRLQAAFPGNLHIASINKTLICLPTDEEVIATLTDSIIPPMPTE